LNFNCICTRHKIGLQLKTYSSPIGAPNFWSKRRREEKAGQV